MSKENETARRSIFDAFHPPSEDLMEDCVHCGFCLSTCPTYLLWGQEADSPRGRIYLMQMGHDGQVEMSENFVQHFDRCLGCMACVTACPSGVQYEKLIEATRSQIERNFSRSFSDRLFRRMIFSLFPHPARLRAMAGPLWLYQRSGLQRLASRLGLWKRLPPRWQALESLLPPVSLTRARIPAVMPAQATAGATAGVAAEGRKHRRVGLLLGCVQQVFFSDVNAATARVLAAEGFEVVTPPVQGCCGALMVHAGHEEEARKLARRTIDTFERAQVETVVINAAGCGSTVKEYGHLLRDDPAYAERAAAFASRCRDISEVLTEREPQAPRHPLPLKVAYHDACHLQHAQKVREQPRRLLATVPRLEVLEIPEAAICCGSAGIYNLVEPEAAQDLGDRKAGHILTTGAEVLASSNPGCLLQIRNSLQRAGRTLPAVHVIELLDASIRGVWPAAVPRKESFGGNT